MPPWSDMEMNPRKQHSHTCCDYCECTEHKAQLQCRGCSKAKRQKRCFNSADKGVMWIDRTGT